MLPLKYFSKGEYNMPEKITAYLFSTDENFTEFPTMSDAFIEFADSLGEDGGTEPVMSIVTYITDEYVERYEDADFTDVVERCDIGEDLGAIVFIQTNINDPKLRFVCDLFGQFTGLGYMCHNSVFYGKSGDLIFVANNISQEINDFINAIYLKAKGWDDITSDDKPPMFDVLFDYAWDRSNHYYNTLSTDRKCGKVFQLYIITGDIDEDDDDRREYYDVMHICEIIDVRFGDKGAPWPRLSPRVIKYSDFPDIILKDGINEYEFAFMWATPNCDGKGLSEEESEECIDTILSLFDILAEDDIYFPMHRIERVKPNGDKVIFIGSKNAKLDRILNTDLLMSRVMTMYFNGRTD
jgi:hypothetical protein